MQLHNTVAGLIILLNCKYPIQYNVVFTQPFGISQEKEEKWKNSMDFLNNQYFTLQQHERKSSMTTNKPPFKIFKMQHQHSGTGSMMLIYDSSKNSPEGKEEKIESMNR